MIANRIIIKSNNQINSILTNLNNNKEIIKTYNSIYEKLYSFDKSHVKKRKKVILKNLREIKIKNFYKLDVMDVGTGIQGYVFYLLKFTQQSLQQRLNLLFDHLHESQTSVLLP